MGACTPWKRHERGRCRENPGAAARGQYGHDRGCQQLGQSGIAIGAASVEAVVQALVALDQADIGTGALSGEGRADFFV